MQVYATSLGVVDPNLCMSNYASLRNQSRCCRGSKLVHVKLRKLCFVDPDEDLLERIQ